MTNELPFTTVMSRNPLDPMILTLTGLWLLSLCISVISIVMAIVRIAKRRPVRLLANLNILTAMVLWLCSVAAVLWMLQRGVEIWMKAELTPSMSVMMVYYWTAPIMELAISTIIFGSNLVIGIVLYMKWREPRPSSPGDVATSATPGM